MLKAEPGCIFRVSLKTDATRETKMEEQQIYLHRAVIQELKI